MKTQNTPLYATDQVGETYCVIGWEGSRDQIPIVVSLEHYGRPQARWEDLKYSVETPAVVVRPAPAARTAPIPNANVRVVPTDAQTEIITRGPAIQKW